MLGACAYRVPDRADTASGRLPDAIVGRKINVYALWTRAASSEAWALRYVGQRSLKFGERRLREHLFKVDPRTQSKLAEIRQALADGHDVGVTGILVEPDSLRLTIEDELISIAKQRGQLWNRKGGPRST